MIPIYRWATINGVMKNRQVATINLVFSFLILNMIKAHHT